MLRKKISLINLLMMNLKLNLKNVEIVLMTQINTCFGFVANLVYSKVGTDCEISTNCNSCYLSNVPNRDDCEVGTLFLKLL